MCGIVGYIGWQEAAPLLIKGLKRLEYRGYDSAGIALMNGSLLVMKQKGSVSGLEEASEGLSKEMKVATVGIGHTRWATHGEPSDTNAHPHQNASGDIAVIHNGIIENYSALKQELIAQGYVFFSDTDSEVLVHLIDRIWKSDPSLDLESATRNALRHVDGAYGICVISSREPDKIVVARKGSPLVIGIGSGEYYIASDAAPIVEHTNKVVYLSDGELAVVKKDGYLVKTIENVAQEKIITELDFSIEKIEKGETQYSIRFKNLLFYPDTYKLGFYIADSMHYNIQDKIWNCAEFNIIEGSPLVNRKLGKFGFIFLTPEWNVIK